MKVKVITVATHPAEGLDRLVKSLNKFEVDYEILGLGAEWNGFGTKIKLVQNYLQSLKGYTHFIFIDAYDVCFLSDLALISQVYRNYYNDKIVFSTEKGCWPYPDKANQYPLWLTPWKYLNSGSYMAPIGAYLDLIENYSFDYQTDDQAYFTDIFLSGGGITLDTGCKIFQSIAFETDTDFKYMNGHLFNKQTRSMPDIIHGNGRTPMQKIYDLI